MYWRGIFWNASYPERPENTNTNLAVLASMSCGGEPHALTDMGHATGENNNVQ